MAEESQIPEYNGNEQPEIIPAQITDIIDQMDTSVVCEKRECDPVFTSTEGTGIHLVGKVFTPVLATNEETIEEEQKDETRAILEKDPEVSICHETEPEAHKEGECQTRLETDGASTATCTFPGQEDLSEQSKDHEGVETETPDILLYDQRKPLAETSAEDTLTETEEENTSIENDNENGEGSCDDQENGPQESLSVSPNGSHLESTGNRPDISRHSYSRYDTVSYRKIRKGNTKQRIDEFESMMNL